MKLEGQVTIDLAGIPDAASPRRERSLLVRFDQPGKIETALKGKTPQQALDMISVLFTLCGMAQKFASHTALSMAMGAPINPAEQARRQALVEMESLREHFLRIMLDWPGFIGAGAQEKKNAAASVAPAMRFVARLKKILFPDGKAFALLQKGQGEMAIPMQGKAEALVDESAALLADLVFGMTPEKWLKLVSSEQIENWAQNSDTVAASFITSLMDHKADDTAPDGPSFTPEKINGALVPAIKAWLEAKGKKADDEAIIFAGSQSGKQGDLFDARMPETTPFSRNCNHPIVKAACQNRQANALLARHLARLVELAGLPVRMHRLLADGSVFEQTGTEGQGGFGWSHVAAARGSLIHGVQLDDSSDVARYRILPPTRLNFAGNGIAAQLIGHLCQKRAYQGQDVQTETSLRRQIDLIVNAIDPCVGYQVLAIAYRR